MPDTLTTLLTDRLRDAYSAEKQALRGMARARKKASAASLQAAIQTHIDQTEGQIGRLERAMDEVGAKPGRKLCDGMKGILEEAQGELADRDKGPMLDALIIAGLQRVEHYEIAAYGTMAALAKACGADAVARLMAETLAEEKQTDGILSRLAEQEVNPAMVAAARAEEAKTRDAAPAAARRAPQRRKAA